MEGAVGRSNSKEPPVICRQHRSTTPYRKIIATFTSSTKLIMLVYSPNLLSFLFHAKEHASKLVAGLRPMSAIASIQKPTWQLRRIRANKNQLSSSRDEFFRLITSFLFSVHCIRD